MKDKAVTVKSGPYTGLKGTVKREYPKSVQILVTERFESDDEDDWDSTYYDEGDTVTVSKASVGIDDDADFINAQIVQQVVTLRGLILKRQMIVNPKKAMEEVERVLSMVCEGEEV